MHDISGNISPSLTSHSSLSQKFRPSLFNNLARLNPAIDQSEIKNLQTHQTELEEALAETRFRLDSLHLVVCENWEFLGLTFQPHINKWTAEASVSF